MKTIRLEKGNGEQIIVKDILNKEVCHIDNEGSLIMNQSTVHNYELNQINIVASNFWLFYNNIK